MLTTSKFISQFQTLFLSSRPIYPAAHSHPHFHVSQTHKLSKSKTKLMIFLPEPTHPPMLLISVNGNHHPTRYSSQKPGSHLRHQLSPYLPGPFIPSLDNFSSSSHSFNNPSLILQLHILRHEKWVIQW